MRIFIKAVLFDMDGVITNTMPYHYRAWQSVFHDEGLRISKHEVYSREGQKGLNSILEIFAKYGKSVSFKKAKALLKNKERLFNQIAHRRFISGARSFVTHCHYAGFKLGLVTGTSRHEVEKILPGNLRNCFDVIISGNDVKNGKPHPEPYIKAFKALKIRGEDAIVIENAPFGIQSAKKAGLVCFALKTSLPASYLKEADKIFYDFWKLEKFFHASIGIKKP